MEQSSLTFNCYTVGNLSGAEAHTTLNLEPDTDGRNKLAYLEVVELWGEDEDSVGIELDEERAQHIVTWLTNHFHLGESKPYANLRHDREVL